jgi:hypothetical protein
MTSLDDNSRNPRFLASSTPVPYLLLHKEPHIRRPEFASHTPRPPAGPYPPHSLQYHVLNLLSILYSTFLVRSAAGRGTPAFFASCISLVSKRPSHRFPAALFLVHSCLI